MWRAAPGGSDWLTFLVTRRHGISTHQLDARAVAKGVLPRSAQGMRAGGLKGGCLLRRDEWKPVLRGAVAGAAEDFAGEGVGHFAIGDDGNAVDEHPVHSDR